MTPTDRFTRYLLELDDESFFSVYRNYLGPISTPYNKHDLITSLRDFLARSVTQSRIVGLLDDEDRMLLSAVELLGQPEEQRLFRFLEGEMPYTVFRARLLNLKDRMLVIDGTVDDSLQLNPILLAALRSAGLGAHTLLAGEEIPVPDRLTAEGPPWFSIACATALYAFLRDTGDLFTRTGSIRKRASAELEERFGTLLSGEEGALRLRTAVIALETLGLARRDEEQVAVRPDSWEELTQLPDRWIQALLWSATLTSTVERAFEFAELLLHLLQSMPTDRRFTLGETVRLLQLTGNGMHLPVDRDTVFRLADIGVFLEHHGEANADQDETRYRLNPAAATAVTMGGAVGTSSPTAHSTVRVQANMEVSIPPGVPFADALTVARISALLRYDVVPLFVLTAEATAAARREGIDNPLERLKAIAGDLPQNVRFLIRRWQERAGAVRLLRGLILIADEEEGAVLERSEEFLELRRDTLAPGVFLMTDDSRRVERLLSRLELGSATMVEGQRPVDVDVPEFGRLFQRFRQPALTATSSLFSTAAELPSSQAAVHGEHAAGSETGTETETDDEPGGVGALPGELHRTLADAQIPEDVRQELALRIDRKLILFPEQIRGDVVPQYGTEARGLDYLGKIRIIEQAIGNGDLLEIVTRAGNGTPQRVMVQPREIVESGNDLMLRARQQPDQRAVRIRIRRMSLVRRLSGTLLRRG